MKNRTLNIFITGIIIIVCFSGMIFGCPAPKVDALSVNKGINTETVELTITGSSFHKSTYVKLTKTGEADIMAENVKVVSAKQVTCSLNLSGKTTGQWNVVVANIGSITKKDKPTVIADGFTIENPSLSITGIEPNKATNNMVVNMVIHGDHFRSGAKVVLSSGQMDIGATNVKVNSDTLVSCSFDLNGAATGTYSVRLVNDDGKTGVLANSFTIDKPVTSSALTISTVSPGQGFNNGTVVIRIAGTGFDPKTGVKLTGEGLNDIPGTDVKIETATALSCSLDINAKPAGLYNVVLTTPDGQSATLTGGFKIVQYVAKADPNTLLKPIFFDYNKSELRSDQLGTIASDVQILKNNPQLYILLGGHADERGTREYNLELSRKRAETVQQYLLKQGVSPERIVIYAYGKDYPAKKGRAEDVLAYNRRVDIIVYDSRPTKMSGIRDMNE